MGLVSAIRRQDSTQCHSGFAMVETSVLTDSTKQETNLFDVLTIAS